MCDEKEGVMEGRRKIINKKSKKTKQSTDILTSKMVLISI